MQIFLSFTIFYLHLLDKRLLKSALREKITKQNETYLVDPSGIPPRGVAWFRIFSTRHTTASLCYSNVPYPTDKNHFPKK